MSVEIYLSTDGKHTVRVSAEQGEVTEAYAQAKKIYDLVLKDYGKGTQQGMSMENKSIPTCKIHKSIMKLHPAGVSKRTGKPYAAFWGCPVPDCRETMKAE